MASAPYESADLLLKLYDLRRETKMRDARTWFIGFTPESTDDLFATLQGPSSASFRMVATYWDMAASFVLNGAIDEQMFNDANGEHVLVFAKLEPFLAEYRQRLGSDSYFAQLEKLVVKQPGIKEVLAATRERFRAMAAARR